MRLVLTNCVPNSQGVHDIKRERIYINRGVIRLLDGASSVSKHINIINLPASIRFEAS